jgi:tRNA A37 N6-isopentenylltransferase MiaA
MDKRIKQLLKRQAKWQRNRAALSWEEKLRMSLIMSETQRALRGSAGLRQDPSKKAASTPQKE